MNKVIDIGLTSVLLLALLALLALIQMALSDVDVHDTFEGELGRWIDEHYR